jgi:signal transduction histidine kinase
VSGVSRGALAVALPTDPLRERRDRVLAELGSRLAHDINTPVAALHGHLDLIAHQPISPTALDSVGTCQRELVRLQTTAQDLLTFTRLRAGGGRRGQHLAGAIAEDATAALVDRADELGATLSVEVPNERVVVDVAEADIVRALRNLIANALAYGLGEAREVVVSAEADEDTVTFAVTDSGPGLSAEQVAELSEPLTRGAGVTGPGSGLGLTIVAETLTAHGSRLETQPNPGRSTLFFVLPRARP